MPVKYSRLSKRKVNQLMQYFSADLGATQAAQLSNLNRNTVNDWYTTFRKVIAEFQEEQVKQSSGEFELDESYFGGPRKKTHVEDRRKRGRGAENKVPVFGIKKRDDGSVYTQIIPNASKSTLFPIIKQLVIKHDSTIYTDKFRTYDGLVFDGYKHYRINHSKKYSNRKGIHINGIENFWSFAKLRLAKFRGLSRKNFYFHLKECEFRYNKKHDMMKVLKARLRSLLV
ncbi:MAG: IS1595 family transposase [Candidatus Pacebacteria bacterium]|nr:IS1595 family transposase [Candidatus Paceibacterota bacterium]